MDMKPQNPESEGGQRRRGKELRAAKNVTPTVQFRDQVREMESSVEEKKSTIVLLVREGGKGMVRGEIILNHGEMARVRGEEHFLFLLA